MSVCNLIEFYKENSDSCRSIVIKHFPEESDEKDLKAYLELISKSDVTRVCVPGPRCGVAIATFADIVFDKRILGWQERAFSKDFRGYYPTLDLLERPAGILVTNVPTGVTEELLQLYFESRKSGGIEGTVDKSVELVTVGEHRHVIVPITNEDGIEIFIADLDL